MVPEILIVGDEARRTELGRRVEELGYDAAHCSPADMSQRLEAGPAPAAIVVAVSGGEAPMVMAELRRSRRGAAVPVTLAGKVGEGVRDLADVLDLGADHFLEEPISDEQLRGALEALAGPPMRTESSAKVGEAQGPDTAVSPPPSRTEVLPGEGDADPPADGSSGTAADRGGDPVIGRLHRTLDLLEGRLRSRQGSSADGGDALERALLELSPVPVDADVEVPDPGESHSSMEIVRPPTETRTKAKEGEARERTVMLEAAAPLDDAVLEPVLPPEDPGSDSVSRLTRQTSSWSDAHSGPGSYDEVHELSSGRLLYDRPRRMTPLPVEAEGTLDKVEVPRLIWKLHRAGFSGRLALRRGRVEKDVWMERGEVVFARSNLEHDRLNDALLRRGMLTRPQYEAARRLAAKSPRRVGQLLVESGFLKASELPRVIRQHLSRIVDSTFPWNEGKWTLTVAERCEEPVKLHQPMARVVFDGVRHRIERTQLWALLGGPRQYPSLVERAAERPAKLADSLELSPAESAWLARLDGSKSLEELTSSAGTDELELLALVYGLHVIELLEIHGEARAAVVVAFDPSDVDLPRIEERLVLARQADYFELLGLPRDASATDARRAYADLSRTFADDQLDPQTREGLATQIQEIRVALAEARDVLVDDALRTTYLAHLEEP